MLTLFQLRMFAILIMFLFLFGAKPAHSDVWPLADETQTESILRSLVNADIFPITVRLDKAIVEGGYNLVHGPEKVGCGFIRAVVVSGIPQLDEFKLTPSAVGEKRAVNSVFLVVRIQNYYLGYPDWDKPNTTSSHERTDLWVSRMARCKREGERLVHDGFVIQYTWGYRDFITDKEIVPCDLISLKVISRPEDSVPAK